MGMITGTAIQGKVSTVLNDAGVVRWTGAELLGWINSGQREVCFYKPNARTETKNIALVAGAKQSIASGDVALLSVARNMGSGGTTPGRAIQTMTRTTMDTAVPDWPTAPYANAAVKAVIFDERDPHTFYTWPAQPANTTQQVEGIVAVLPTELSSLSSTIDLDDIYEAPLIDYVLFRAFSKETTSPANIARADFHHKNFLQAVATKTQLEGVLNPNTEPRDGAA